MSFIQEVFAHEPTLHWVLITFLIIWPLLYRIYDRLPVYSGSLLIPLTLVILVITLSHVSLPYIVSSTALLWFDYIYLMCALVCYGVYWLITRHYPYIRQLDRIYAKIAFFFRHRIKGFSWLRYQLLKYLLQTDAAIPTLARLTICLGTCLLLLLISFLLKQTISLVPVFLGYVAGISFMLRVLSWLGLACWFAGIFAACCLAAFGIFGVIRSALYDIEIPYSARTFMLLLLYTTSWFIFTAWLDSAFILCLLILVIACWVINQLT